MFKARIEGSNPSLSAKYLQAPNSLGALFLKAYREMT